MFRAPCELQIRLDRPQRTYRVGEPITGVITVTATTDCTCQSLEVEVGWTTVWRGDTNSEVASRTSIFAGEWKEGVEYTYPFEISAPPGPLTYVGHLLGVDWTVAAQATFPWSWSAAEATTDFTLHGPERPQPLLLGPRDRERSIFGAPFSRAGRGPFLDLIVATGALLWVGLACIEGVVRGSTSFEMILSSVVTLALTGWSLAQPSARRAVASLRLGGVELHLNPTLAAQGSPVHVELRLCPPTDVHLREIRATLRCTEICIEQDRSRWDDRRYRKFHRSHEREEPHLLLSDETLPRGDRRIFQATLPIPLDGPNSFKAEKMSCAGRSSSRSSSLGGRRGASTSRSRCSRSMRRTHEPRRLPGVRPAHQRNRVRC